MLEVLGRFRYKEEQRTEVHTSQAPPSISGLPSIWVIVLANGLCQTSVCVITTHWAEGRLCARHKGTRPRHRPLTRAEAAAVVASPPAGTAPALPPARDPPRRRGPLQPALRGHWGASWRNHAGCWFLARPVQLPGHACARMWAPPAAGLEAPGGPKGLHCP